MELLEILVKLAGLGFSLTGVFALVERKLSFRGHEINLAQPDIRVNPNRVDNFNFQSPSRVLTLQLAILVGDISPTYVTKSCGDVGVDSQATDAGTPLKHGNELATGGRLVCAAYIQFARGKNQAFSRNEDLSRRIVLFHIQRFALGDFINQQFWIQGDVIGIGTEMTGLKRGYVNAPEIHLANDFRTCEYHESKLTNGFVS